MRLRTPAERRRVRHVRSVVAAVNRHDFAALSTMFSDDLVINGEPWGHERMREDLEALVGSFPDFQWRIDDLFVEGRSVAACLHDTGTHMDDFRGVSRTGRRMETHEMIHYRFADGLIAAMRISADQMLLRDRIVELDRRRRRGVPPHA